MLKFSVSILLLILLWSCNASRNQKRLSLTGHWIAVDTNNHNIDIHVFAAAKSTKFEIRDKQKGFLYKLSLAYNPENKDYRISNIPFENKEARIFGKVQVFGDTMLIEIDNQWVKFLKK